MAFSVTSSGVALRSGRGTNAVTVEVTFKRIEAWAKRMKIDEARLWRLSYGRACFGLKKKFRDVMKSSGGILGVPKFKDFEDFTKAYRTAYGRPIGHLGGALSEESNIVAFKRNGCQIVGWPDSMEKRAKAFQDGVGVKSIDEIALFEPAARLRLHQRGIKDIPQSYAHNPRPVIQPYFMDYIRQHLDEWAKGAFYKDLAKRMRKAGEFK